MAISTYAAPTVRWLWLLVYPLGLSAVFIVASRAPVDQILMLLLVGMSVSALQLVADRCHLREVGFSWIVFGTITFAVTMVMAIFAAALLPEGLFGQFWVRGQIDVSSDVGVLRYNLKGMIHLACVLSLMIIMMSALQAMFLRVRHRPHQAWFWWHLFASVMAFLVGSGPIILALHTSEGQDLLPVLLSVPALHRVLVTEFGAYSVALVLYSLLLGLFSYPIVQDSTAVNAILKG